MSMRVTELRPADRAEPANETSPRVRVMHTRPDAALSHTVRAPIYFADEDGKIYEIDEWSLEGVIWPEMFAPDEIDGELCLNFQGFNISFPTSLKRGAEDDQMLFTSFERRQLELLREFYKAIQSGRMAGIDDLILSMDLPVELVPMTQTEEDLAEEAPRRSRLARGIASLGVSIVLAAAVLASVGYVVWQRVNYVETSGAQIVNTGPAVLAEAWVEDADLMRVWIGMDARVELNVDGQSVSLPAEVTALAADPGLLPREDRGILATVALDPSAAEGLSMEMRQPAVLRLDRNLDAALLTWLQP